MSHTRVTIAVFAHRGDAGAEALVSLLRRRGRAGVVFATEDAVARAVIVHRPSSGPHTAGADPHSLAGDRMQLPDGTVVGPSTGAIVWRLGTLPVPEAPAEHRRYAESEAYALGLSWLHGLRDAVIHPPDSRTLSGAQPDLLGLAQLARRHGVAMPAFTIASNDAAHAGTRLSGGAWPEMRVPVALPPAHDIGTPRTAAPALRVEEHDPLGSVLVLGDQVVASDPHLHLSADLVRRLAALVADAGSSAAEVMLARRHDGDVVVTGLYAVPQLRAPAQLAAYADFVEAHAARVEAVAA